jgi:hypothetical protein
MVPSEALVQFAAAGSLALAFPGGRGQRLEPRAQTRENDFSALACRAEVIASHILVAGFPNRSPHTTHRRPVVRHFWNRNACDGHLVAMSGQCRTILGRPSMRHVRAVTQLARR